MRQIGRCGVGDTAQARDRDERAVAQRDAHALRSAVAIRVGRVAESAQHELDAFRGLGPRAGLVRRPRRLAIPACVQLRGQHARRQHAPGLEDDGVRVDARREAPRGPHGAAGLERVHLDGELGQREQHQSGECQACNDQAALAECEGMWQGWDPGRQLHRDFDSPTPGCIRSASRE